MLMVDDYWPQEAVVLMLSLMRLSCSKLVLPLHVPADRVQFLPPQLTILKHWFINRR